MFLGQGVLWQQVFNALSTATHLNSSSPSQEESLNPSLNETAASLKNTLATLAEGGEPAMATLAAWRPKNPETQTTAPKENTRANAKLDSVFDDSLLPEADLVDNLVEIYFANIHPWIPMLHVRQFRERMLDPEQRPQLSTIFHAIVSLCARFSQDVRLGSPEEKTRYAKRCRQFVILNSMESFSVENLQALTIIAFDTVSPSAHPKYVTRSDSGLTDWKRPRALCMGKTSCQFPRHKADVVVNRWKHDENCGATATQRGRRRPATGFETSHKENGVPETLSILE